jgi:hypothetical protein
LFLKIFYEWIHQDLVYDVRLFQKFLYEIWIFNKHFSESEFVRIYPTWGKCVISVIFAGTNKINFYIVGRTCFIYLIDNKNHTISSKLVHIYIYAKRCFMLHSKSFFYLTFHINNANKISCLTREHPEVVHSDLLRSYTS